MSATEILDELPKLTPVELQRIQERILELEEAQEIEETPELLAAVDDGLRSLENEPTTHRPRCGQRSRSGLKVIEAQAA